MARRRRKHLAQYRSGLEEVFAHNLKEAGIEFEHEAVKIEFYDRVPGSKCHQCGAPVYKTRHYLVDFTIEGPDGPVHIETKGRFTAPDRKKMRLVKEQHPESDIRIVFQEDRLTGLKRHKRNSDWAEAYGFPYSVGTAVPEGWF